MIIRIQTQNVLTLEDELLDLGVALWDREQELEMPYWYWIDNEYVEKKGIVVALRNKIKRLERLNHKYWQDQYNCQIE